MIMRKKTDPRLVRLGPMDNVVVLAANLPEGEEVAVDSMQIALARALKLGHTIAARDIAEGETVLKYSAPIGVASKPIPCGTHVHVHNVRSNYTAPYVRSEAD